MISLRSHCSVLAWRSAMRLDSTGLASRSEIILCSALRVSLCSTTSIYSRRSPSALFILGFSKEEILNRLTDRSVLALLRRRQTSVELRGTQHYKT